MKKFIEEFKAFAMKGNVIDLAIAVVIGGAFGKIVTSFTNDIIMPIVGVLVGGVDFSDLVWTLKEATEDSVAVTVNYGAFINTVITFFIVALAVFVAIKAVNNMHAILEKEKKAEEEKKETPKPSKEEILLTEIRDLLKNK